MGLLTILSNSGVRVVSDVGAADGPHLYLRDQGIRVIAVNSARASYYSHNLFGMETWFGSTRDCVLSALSGEMGGAAMIKLKAKPVTKGIVEGEAMVTPNAHLFHRRDGSRLRRYPGTGDTNFRGNRLPARSWFFPREKDRPLVVGSITQHTNEVMRLPGLSIRQRKV